MTFCKLEAPLPVEFLEKGSALSYPMMVSEVAEGTFELSNANVKLEVLYDRHGR